MYIHTLVLRRNKTFIALPNNRKDRTKTHSKQRVMESVNLIPTIGLWTYGPEKCRQIRDLESLSTIYGRKTFWHQYSVHGFNSRRKSLTVQKDWLLGVASSNKFNHRFPIIDISPFQFITSICRLHFSVVLLPAIDVSRRLRCDSYSLTFVAAARWHHCICFTRCSHCTSNLASSEVLVKFFLFFFLLLFHCFLHPK